jgi:small-conductance mechanosensitive channel
MQHNNHSRSLWKTVKLLVEFVVVFVVLFTIFSFREFLSGQEFIAQVLLIVFNVVVIYLVLDIISTVSATIINYGYRKKNQISSDHIDNFTVGINNLARLAHFLVFFILMMGVYGDMTRMLASTAIILGIVGLAFRDYVLNFVSGLNIMFTGRFKLGEYIKVGENKGKITGLTFSHVQLLTDTKDVVFVPNNIITSAQVVNYSKGNIKKVFADFSFSIDRYPEYKNVTQKLIARVSDKFRDVLSSRDGVKVHIESVENSSMKGLIEFDVSQYSFELERKLKNYTAEALVELLNEKPEVVKKTVKGKVTVNKKV